MDIASLGIKIDTSDVAKATTDLDRVVQSGERAEKAADGVTAGFDKASVAASDLSKAGKQLAETTEEAKARLLAMAKVSLDSSEYYQTLTTSVNSNAAALNASGSSASSLAALQRRLQAESDALVGTTDKMATATRQAAAATGVQADGLQALLGKINPAIAALDKLDQQQAQLQKYKSAGLIDADTFREYSTRIDASRQQLGSFDETLRKTGVSSGQTQAALRQLPAQFTDIFTSLAGGQNPLMVLIQQGGQIKDSFGGIGPTMDALKDKFRSLFTGGAGAAALGESLAGVAGNAKNVSESAGEAGESLSNFAESSNTAAEAAENAKKAVGAISPVVSGASFSFAGIALAVLAAAAALGTLVYGYSQGSKERDEFNKALILTGNAAGTSSGQLADLAQQVSATNGTTSEAAASLAKLAASGVVAGGSFKDIADAAAAMEDATGKSVDATIAEFVKIAKDPVAAAKELNEQYHFLTASVYSQIVALKEQGDTIGAAKLLTDTYAETVKGRSGEITQNLGPIEKAWKGITDEAKKSLDAIKNIGREQGDQSRITEISQKIAYLQSTVGTGYEDGDTKARLTALKDELNLLQDKKAAQEDEVKRSSNSARIQKEGIDAEQRLKQISDSTLTNAEKRNKLIKDYLRDVEKLRLANPADPKVQPDFVARTLQNIKDKNKDPKAASAGAVDLSAFNDAENALKELQAAYSNTEKQLDAAQKAGLISQEAYATQRSVLIKAEKEEVTSAYQAEIDAIEAAKAKKTTTSAQRIQLDQKIADARTNMVKAQKDADSQLEVLATNEQGRLKKQALAISTYTDALNQQNITLRQQGQREAASLGMGDRQKGLQSQFNGIDDKANAQRIDLANQYGDGSRGMSLDEYNAKLKAVAQSQQDLRNTVVANYGDMTSAQGSWTAGASSAWENYLESTRDVAGQTKSLFTNAFSSMEDAVANFALTGKLSFSDFAKSILADMARIATRQASSSALSGLFGLATTAASSYFGGSGTTSAGSTQAGYSSTYFPQAKGGAWSGGVQMFANGGAFSDSVVSKPTAFGMANGKTGIMGEAGPEAIVPLARDSQGRLGVRGGANSSTVNVSVTVDASEGGGASPDPARLAEAIKVVCRQEIATARRNGGQLA
ncbi:phage tail tape measure protein [Pseudomonas sp.]|uniref:phage tail tape measure protein n=1 Tax=Pseudomonas sp. TaxID=306 RepID=UPI003267E843